MNTTQLKETIIQKDLKPEVLIASIPLDAKNIEYYDGLPLVWANIFDYKNKQHIIYSLTKEMNHLNKCIVLDFGPTIRKTIMSCINSNPKRDWKILTYDEFCYEYFEYILSQNNE